MADGYARSTGKPGVLCVVPGPGLTNSLTGLGEALLDSIPMVCIVGDVARGDKYRPFQVHSLPQAGLLAARDQGRLRRPQRRRDPAWPSGRRFGWPGPANPGRSAWSSPITC